MEIEWNVALVSAVKSTMNGASGSCNEVGRERAKDVVGKSECNKLRTSAGVKLA